ncbi:HAD family phosphatase [Patescibacteria group bacterium]|nr:HAD family phosphatase [Patescibacteria group bacterium]
MKDAIHLICFDLDGVIISSMDIAIKVFKKVMEEELGLTSDLFEQKKFLALSPEDKFEQAWGNKIKEKNISEEEIEHAMNLYRQGKINSELPLKPYAKEAIELMTNNFQHLAIVSSNRKYVIEDTLKKYNLISYFEHIQGTDDKEDSKPNPEIYQKAVTAFSIDPKNAITFEDSTHGIHSAKGAGMKAIGVATGVETIEDLKKAGADLVLSNLGELDISLVYQLFSK